MRNDPIAVDDIGDVTLIGFRQKRLLGDDELDDVRAALYRLVDDFGRRKLVIDLSGLEYWSDSLLGALVRLFQKLRMIGGRFVICHISKNARDIFAITKLDRIFTLSDASREACVRELLRTELPRQAPDPEPPIWSRGRT